MTPTAFIPTSHTSILNVFSYLVHSQVRLQSLDRERYPTTGTYMGPEFWVVETIVQTVEVHFEVYLKYLALGYRE